VGNVSYLTFTNKILKRIKHSTIADVTAASGTSLIVTEMINEAVEAISTVHDWSELYTARSFATGAGSATVTLASDFGKNIDLYDTDNNYRLGEVSIRLEDVMNNRPTATGVPKRFAIIGQSYTFNPIPSSAINMRERYHARPTAMTSNTDVTSLASFTDNIVLYLSLMRAFEYHNEFSQADRIRASYNKELKDAIKYDRSLVDKVQVFHNLKNTRRSHPFAVLPSEFGQDA